MGMALMVGIREMGMRMQHGFMPVEVHMFLVGCDRKIVGMLVMLVVAVLMSMFYG